MHNSAYKLLKHIKNAAAMGSGSFMPPEPLPNSVKANQIEQQELAEQQGAASAGAGNEQMMQMQKAQEDAVNELQQTKQQLAQMQGELQNVQAQSQQQQQAMQMQAQQEIQKAQMDAQYELQSEKIKNQQKLLSVQEKSMRTAGKAKPDQNHILSNQLKRVVRKVNSLKVSNVAPAVGLKATGMAAGKAIGRAVPFAGAAISGASAVNNLSKGNYLSAGVDALGGAASFLPVVGVPLAVGSSFLSSALENKPQEPAPAPEVDPAPTQSGDVVNALSGVLSGGFGAPQQPQTWDAGLSPSERFSVMNQAMGKRGSEFNPLAAGGPQLYQKMRDTTGDASQQATYPDIRKFMKNPPPPGEDIASPIPILQAGFGQPKFNMPQVKQQVYGPLGDFIKQLIFQVGFPMFGMRNPLHPDFSKVHGSLVNNEAYKVQPPNTFY
jgi:hypothetical protein